MIALFCFYSRDANESINWWAIDGDRVRMVKKKQRAQMKKKTNEIWNSLNYRIEKLTINWHIVGKWMARIQVSFMSVVCFLRCLVFYSSCSLSVWFRFLFVHIVVCLWYWHFKVSFYHFVCVTMMMSFHRSHSHLLFLNEHTHSRTYEIINTICIDSHYHLLKKKYSLVLLNIKKIELKEKKNSCISIFDTNRLDYKCFQAIYIL